MLSFFDVNRSITGNLINQQNSLLTLIKQTNEIALSYERLQFSLNYSSKMRL